MLRHPRRRRLVAGNVDRPGANHFRRRIGDRSMKHAGHTAILAAGLCLWLSDVAIAQPEPAKNAAAGRTIVLLDDAITMGDTSGGASAIERARRHLLALAKQQSADGQSPRWT